MVASVASAFPSVLAQVVASRGLQPEPVATDALTHLLSTSASAGAALTKWASEICGGEPFGPLTYSTQVTAQDALGRPDLVAADAEGVRLVAEAKFDALLTDLQGSGAYLDRLPSGRPGLLLFIVPEDRLSPLWPKLLSLGTQTGPVAPASAVPVEGGLLTHPLGDGRVVAAITWAGLLGLLQHAVDVGRDARGKGDLVQLAGLVSWRSRTGWTPLLPGDLPETSGRQLRGLRECVVKAATQVSAQKIRNGTSDGGPGRYLRTGGGRWIWIGLWFSAWDRFGNTPVWATIRTQSDESFAALSAALAVLESPGRSGRYRTDTRQWAVPLQIPQGSERDEVTASLVAQLTSLASLVDQAPGAVTTPDPGLGGWCFSIFATTCSDDYTV